MRRLLALLAAVALVLGAVLIRQHLDSGDESRGGDGAIRLRCGTELRAVCTRLASDDSSIELTIEDEGLTADTLASTRPPTFDAWLVAGPWQAMVDEARARKHLDEQVLAAPSKVLGRSPVTLVGPADRMAALSAHCGDTPTWSCIGDVSGQDWSSIGGQATWGTFRAGLAPPDTGAGLVALDQAVASEAGRTDWDSADLEDQSGWLAQLVGSARLSPDPFDQMLVQTGWASVVAPLEQGSAPALAGRRDETVIYPEPVVTADVTLVPVAGRRAGDLLDRIGADRIGATLARAGWHVDGRPAPPGGRGAPTLPPGPNLASAGALQALRGQWDAIR